MGHVIHSYGPWIWSDYMGRLTPDRADSWQIKICSKCGKGKRRFLMAT